MWLYLWECDENCCNLQHHNHHNHHPHGKERFTGIDMLAGCPSKNHHVYKNLRWHKLWQQCWIPCSCYSFLCWCPINDFLIAPWILSEVPEHDAPCMPLLLGRVVHACYFFLVAGTRAVLYYDDLNPQTSHGTTTASTKMRTLHISLSAPAGEARRM
jgi:hypothetical protein